MSRIESVSAGSSRATLFWEVQRTQVLAAPAKAQESVHELRVRAPSTNIDDGSDRHHRSE